MAPAIDELDVKGKAAKEASRKLARISTGVKNKALLNVADGLLARQEEILSANRRDYEEAEAVGISPAMLDRLLGD
jgi:glutamate-5-semialdehyde dehydrogenase